MEIMGYQIPDKKKNNSFLLSLKQQYEKKGRLSLKQHEALEDNLGILIDFYDFERMPNFDKIQAARSLDVLKADFIELRKRVFRNNFRSHKSRNQCIRAVISFLKNGPRYDLINKILYPTGYGWGRRY